jgi:GH24 family phage-related lysozyme (muramidase)
MKEDLLIFDEGVKEIMMSLFSLGATAYEVDYVTQQLKNRPEPIEQKLEALSQAKKVKPNLSFDQAYQKLMDYYKTPQTPKQDVSLDEIADYIIPSEIMGNDLNSPQNKKFFSPYKDDVGLWTIGIGHLIGNGSDKDKKVFVSKYGNRLTSDQIKTMFKKDLVKHLNNAKSKFPTQWKNFSPNLQKVLVDISYRGDLFNPKSTQDFEFLKSIRNNDFKTAAEQYLDHNEYKQRMAKKTDGVVKRMDRNAKIISMEPAPPQITPR